MAAQAVDNLDKQPLFDFVAVREPALVDTADLWRSYIHDDVVESAPAGTPPPPDLSSVEHRSKVAEKVYWLVFCDKPDPARAKETLFRHLRAFLTPAGPTCDPDAFKAGKGLQLSQLTEPHLWFGNPGALYELPERPDQLARLLQPEIAPTADAVKLLGRLAQIAAFVERERNKPDVAELLTVLKQVLTVPVDEAVYVDGAHAPAFAQTRRALFDALYLLYMLRRWATVNLEHLIDALRLLHLVEALAVDVVYARIRKAGQRGNDELLVTNLARRYPAMLGWDGATDLDGFPLLAEAADFDAYLTATPVIHQIFALLFATAKPFNNIQPIGIGDLKVVKHWLRGYQTADISDVDNVLLKEQKMRVHRRLERSEETFTFSSDQESESTKDHQTTDRGELKRETENVLQNSLNLGASANVNVTTTGPTTVVAGATGNFAASRSQTDNAKIGLTFAHEVVDHAIERVHTHVTQSRTTTQLFETEETNTHNFDNKAGKDHVSGFYYWLNKVYRAQVYDYGKRMMFEFTVPEPAALLVESRLQAFASQLDIGQPPSPPQLAKLPQEVAELHPGDIDDKKFPTLAAKYDLTEFTYPTTEKTVAFVDTATGDSLFHAEKQGDTTTWHSKPYACKLAGAKDYRITDLLIDGRVYFWGPGGFGADDDANPGDVNTLRVDVNGERIVDHADNTKEKWYLGGNAPNLTPDGLIFGDTWPAKNGKPFVEDENVTLTFGFWDLHSYDVSVRAKLALSDEALEAWRIQVHAAVVKLAQKAVDDENMNRTQSYQARLSAYQNRLDQLRATAVDDLLQGQGELANSEVIMRELKRQCLAMLAREFDADTSDDLLTPWETEGVRTVGSKIHRFHIDEEFDENGAPKSLDVTFENATVPGNLPVVNVDEARKKGRYVQFLEQAFEWRQLSYILYPYFWQTMPRWVELMNRSDRSDAFYSDFLQAGYARVMVAVTPAYDDAVLHFLATREPWMGGRAPVIGDPLYLAMHDELRRAEDDLWHGTPDGDAWTFTVPTSLVYLQNKTTPLPPLLPE